MSIGAIERPTPQPLVPLSGPDGGQPVDRVETGSRAAVPANGGLPPAPQVDGGMAATMGLSPPIIPPADLALVLQELQHKNQQTQLKCSLEEVNNVKKEQAGEAAQRMQQINEYFDKLAQSKQENFWQKLFGWIAAAVLTIAGAILTAAGGAGGPLLAAGVTMLATMTLQQTGAMNDMIKGLAQSIAKTFGCSAQTAQIVATVLVGAAVAVGAIAGTVAGGPAVGAAMFAQFSSLLFTPDNLEAMGMSKDDAQKWSLGLTIGMMVAGLGAGLASLVKSGISLASELGSKVASEILDNGFLTTLLSRVGGQAASLAGEDLGAEATEMTNVADAAGEAGDAAEKAANVIQKFAKQIEIAARAGSGASNIAGGGFAIGSGVSRRDADRAQADEKDTEAVLLKLQQMFDDDADRMKKVVQAMQETTSIVMNILSGVHTSEKKILTA
jgi:Secretion system effector C (SseC) like family